MNKIVSTLFCGALALISLSVNAQNWMKIQTEDGRELVRKSGKVVLVGSQDKATKTAASLWSVEVVSRETSGNKIYQFTNKASNTTLKLASEDIFAVGAVDAVRHDLDTVKAGYAEYKSLFTVEGKFTVVATATGVVVPDTGSYKDLKPLKIALAKPGDMTHWMNVSELNQCATYSVALLAEIEGVNVADAAYEFVSASENVASTDTVFNIKSKTSGKFLAVDSANVTSKSTVNLIEQDEVFGFEVKFGGNSTCKNFGLLFDPVTDKIAIAVMDATLAWDVTQKKISGKEEADGEPVAWLGNVQFVNDKVDYITVDDLEEPTNGKPYWSAAPAQIATGTPLANGLYIVKSTKGIWGVPFASVCTYYDEQPDLKNEYLPENQWMITNQYKDGIYTYEMKNRYYDVNIPIKKVEACDNEYFVINDGSNATDTVTVKAIEANYGYKEFDKEAIEFTSFTLGLVNKFGAENVYMVLNEDSTLNVLKTDKPLEFRTKLAYADNFNLNSKGERTYAQDVLPAYYLYTLSAKGDTLWVGETVSNVNALLTLSVKKDAISNPYIFKAESDGQYKMLIATDLCVMSGVSAIRVHENGGGTTITAVNNSDVSLFTINEKFDDSEYARLEAGHYVIVDNSKGTAESGDLSENEVLTKKADKTAKFLSLGDKIGDAAAIEENFSLWIDSAHVCNTPADTLFPIYYILKGATVTADSVSGDFLTAKDKYKDTDVLLMSFVTGKAKINETMAKVKAAANTFMFKVTDVENQYTICSAKNTKASLCLVNGTVVLSDQMNALPVIVTRTSVVPTANENIAAAGVQVIAGNGNVTIAGAAGKKVVIANILGQTVANTVIASDNATIAAPAGIVIVTVEGEEAVKTIVK